MTKENARGQSTRRSRGSPEPIAHIDDVLTNVFVTKFEVKCLTCQHNKYDTRSLMGLHGFVNLAYFVSILGGHEHGLIFGLHYSNNFNHVLVMVDGFSKSTHYVDQSLWAENFSAVGTKLHLSLAS